MGSNLHQILRSLCLNTGWKYAVFWKLKRRARMVLTWEDAYSDNQGSHLLAGNNCYSKSIEHVHGGHLSQDPVGLAVAKMSYRVYSLGEGIVGQVAVLGKHRWIHADDHVTSLGSSFELCDGWQSQFSAGIRTILVAPVIPLGVVQLGSLHRVIEDLEVIDHIKGLFLTLQDYSTGHGTNPMPCSMKNSVYLRDVSTSNLALGTDPDCCPENGLEREMPDYSLPSPPVEENLSASNVHPKTVEVVSKHGRPQLFNDESSCLLQSTSNIVNLQHQKQKRMRCLYESRSFGKNSIYKYKGVGSEDNITSLLQKSIMDNNNLDDSVLLEEKVGVGNTNFNSDILDAAILHHDTLHQINVKHKGMLDMPSSSDVKPPKDMEESEFQDGSCYRDTSSTLKFPAGCELHEALGADFYKNSFLDMKAEKAQDVQLVEMPEGINGCQLTSESCQEHLLEAIVANVCHSNNDAKSEISNCTSVLSSQVSGRNPEASCHIVNTINSEGYSVDGSSLLREGKQHCLGSLGFSAVMSPKGFSSTCPSSCSDQLERSSEPAKNNKRRARPGESGRPRPRDRQLIQDRIKELRELVPNGAKCSIDSLLERTIKHMLFLQSITKHADELNKCTNSKKKHHMEPNKHGSSSYEHGSSWAMEVGGHFKVQSILVENLNKNGQMLVEMLCDECSHFLDIAEAIRSLGLNILKGATEAHGDKTWTCFVVEGQNNRSVHRIDILWPLVQILQSKNTMY